MNLFIIYIPEKLPLEVYLDCYQKDQQYADRTDGQLQENYINFKYQNVFVSKQTLIFKNRQWFI